MPVAVECVDVVQRFGTQTVLDRVNWSLPPGVLAGLLGPSGGGKTSLLRILAGLDECRSGRVRFAAAGASNGSAVTAVSKNSSPRIGMVFQNLALWPHMTARRHIECLLAPNLRDQRRRRAEALLEEVQFPLSARDRRPDELSGGEAQRLALARALANEPELLLLDEPLAQLDMPQRGEMLALIQELARARGTTVIYVTHSWPEVLEICDEVAVLIGGRIEQSGAMDDVYRRPASAAVARLTGPVCEIPLECIEASEVFAAPDARLLVDERPDGAYVVRPHQVHLNSPWESNCWRVAASRPALAGWRITLELDSGRQLKIDSPQPWAPGEYVSIQLSNHGDAELAARGASSSAT
jgi:ABC-type sulfate/molybdate transport systems ATPase subunit